MNYSRKPGADQPPLCADLGEIRRTLDVLFAPGDVVEMRAFKDRRCTISGYYSDFERLAQDAARYNGRVGAIYVTLNRLNPDLLARRANRCEEYASTTTSDNQVVRRVWLPIDFDPVRPAGISASQEEHEAAIEKMREVHKFLVGERGWPAPVAADSGNGGHLLWRVDLPNDEESTRLMQGALQALHVKFSDDEIIIDTSNYNAARIWKLHGTIARKGDNTADRPHRLARLLDVPKKIEVVPIEKLRALAAMAPEPDGNHDTHPKMAGTFDLDDWIRTHKLDVAGPTPWQGGRKWVFGTCPWNSEHTNRSAFIVQRPDGSIGAGCHHNGCQGRGWHDLRDVVEPGWRDRRSRPSTASTVYETPRKPAPKRGFVDVDSLIPWKPFPVEVLPEPVRSYVRLTSAAIDCDPSYVAEANVERTGGPLGCDRRGQRHREKSRGRRSDPAD
jgi:hypothetical protein